jgi:hypothetical protein
MERVRDPEDVSLHDALKFVQKLMDKYPEPLEKAKESALEFMRDLDDYRKHIQEIRESPDYTGD